MENNINNDDKECTRTAVQRVPYLDCRGAVHDRPYSTRLKLSVANASRGSVHPARKFWRPIRWEKSMDLIFVSYLTIEKLPLRAVRD